MHQGDRWFNDRRVCCQREGRTDLLPGFISAKTGRTFSAHLVTQEGGKVGFEFPPRQDDAPDASAG